MYIVQHLLIRLFGGISCTNIYMLQFCVVMRLDRVIGGLAGCAWEKQRNAACTVWICGCVCLLYGNPFSIVRKAHMTWHRYISYANTQSPSTVIGACRGYQPSAYLRCCALSERSNNNKNGINQKFMWTFIMYDTKHLILILYHVLLCPKSI